MSALPTRVICTGCLTEYSPVEPPRCPSCGSYDWHKKVFVKCRKPSPPHFSVRNYGSPEEHCARCVEEIAAEQALPERYQKLELNDSERAAIFEDLSAKRPKALGRNPAPTRNGWMLGIWVNEKQDWLRWDDGKIKVVHRISEANELLAVHKLENSTFCDRPKSGYVAQVPPEAR